MKSNSANSDGDNPLSLDLGGYQTVLKAYGNQLDVEGMFATLSEWNEMARLIATSPLDVNAKNSFVTPDSSVYRVILSFFHMHPQMITAKRLERLFEHMQLDSVIPTENRDIIALFKFANKAKSCTMTNTLLDWVETMMDEDDSSVDELLRDDGSSSNQPMLKSDIINRSSVQKRVFHKSELVQIYDFALETNSIALNNGDKCLDILFAMKNKKIVLNGNRVAFVMKAFKNSKNFDAVLELFHSMVALGVKRDTHHVSLAVVAYMRTDQVAKGLTLLDRFEAAGQGLRGFAYFAAAFELLRRLCVKPHFVPFLLTGNNAGGGADQLMQQSDAVSKGRVFNWIADYLFNSLPLVICFTSVHQSFIR